MAKKINWFKWKFNHIVGKYIQDEKRDWGTFLKLEKASTILLFLSLFIIIITLIIMLSRN